MSRFFAVIFCMLVFSGCASFQNYQPVNDEYKGGIATIVDSFTNIRGNRSAHFFVIEKIDNRATSNSIAASYRAGAQVGYIAPTSISRKVKAEAQTLTLTGRITYGAPILALFSTEINVSGQVTFVPKANQTYTVRGFLDKDYSSIWIEDENGSAVTKPIELLSRNKRISQSEKLKLKENIILAQSFDINSLTKEDYFLLLESGISVADVVSKLGEPDNIIENEPTFFRQITPSTDYEYARLGLVRFIRSGEELFVFKSIQKFDLTLYTLDDFKRHLKMQDPRKVNIFANIYYRGSVTDVETLDYFAAEIWKNRHAEDGNLADAMAWLARVIGKSQNPRYRELLSDILKDESIHKKLVKHIGITLKELPTEDVTQFRIN